MRLIPCLLLRGDGLVKGVRFRDHRYVGDPVNAVRIFNEKDADELFFFDIQATTEGRGPRLDVVERLADECYMPFAVGGGIRTVEQIRAVLEKGAEKVALNTAALLDPELINRASASFGAQSIVVAIDVKRDWRGRDVVVSHCGTQKTDRDPVTWASEVATRGAGEILLTSVDRDGLCQGLDTGLVRAVARSVAVPVIAAGGAGSLEHIRAAVVDAGASAVAAGSFFVFYGKHQAVLITYPSQGDVTRLFPRREAQA